jgi:nitrate reductase delta subunit
MRPTSNAKIEERSEEVIAVSPHCGIATSKSAGSEALPCHLVTLSPCHPVTLYEQLASLLDYPDERTAGQLEACLPELRERFPEAAEALTGWRSYLCDHPVWSVEELYTHTFDVNPVCTLDVSYYLFGEDYQRGLFLGQMRESLEAVGLQEGRELPDHLPVVLRWLARVYGSELHADMVSECVLPALRKMDESLADGTNPYRGVLQAVAMVLERDLSEVAKW